MITHDLDTIVRTCDRVGVIVDGKVIVDTLENIVANPHPWIQPYFHGARGAPAWPQVEPRMERDANYTAVGAFVLLAIAAAVAFVLLVFGQR